jgi:hypothetical protein
MLQEWILWAWNLIFSLPNLPQLTMEEVREKRIHTFAHLPLNEATAEDKRLEFEEGEKSRAVMQEIAAASAAHVRANSEYPLARMKWI